MTVKEFYEKINGDYDGVMSRLMTEQRVTKFAVRFIDDTTYNEFFTAYNAGDIQTSFRMAHTMKGVASNLGFSELFTTSSAVTEDLRDGSPSSELSSLVKAMTESYNKVINALNEFKAEM